MNSKDTIKGAITISFRSEEKSKYLAFFDTKKAGKKLFEIWNIPMKIINSFPHSIKVILNKYASYHNRFSFDSIF